MRASIVQEVRFEAAHRLPNVPDGHKCKRLHGHSYRCEIHLHGDVDARLGWVRDLGDISDAFEPLYLQLDHNYLNDIPGLDNPTSEVLAAWLWERLLPSLPELEAIVVHETCTGRCVYQGPGEASARPR